MLTGPGYIKGLNSINSPSCHLVAPYFHKERELTIFSLPVNGASLIKFPLKAYMRGIHSYTNGAIIDGQTIQYPFRHKKSLSAL